MFWIFNTENLHQFIIYIFGQLSICTTKMSQTPQAFTQSLRLIDPINQQRIKQQKRILWPDYQVLALINSFEEAATKQQTELDLSNLFMYCAIEQKLIVKRTNKKEYFNICECYDNEFTHMAVYACKNHFCADENDQIASIKSPSNGSLENRRIGSIQRNHKVSKIDTQSQELYIILSKRVIAIDQVIKTNQKVSISVVALSKEKHLWGGNVEFEEFQSQINNKSQQEDKGLFNSGGQTFGFNITSRPMNLQSSARKNNLILDKRQSRFSNYHNSRKNQQQQERKNGQIQSKQPKESTNTIKLTPQHIRQHEQFLYIQINLTTQSNIPENPTSYNFLSFDIFARQTKPKYGAKYENQSSSESQNQESNVNARHKFRKWMRDQIFLVYTMPFMVFNSYLDSQLNYEENQDLREISFKGSCLMFSAMKKLQIKSVKKQHQQIQTKDDRQSQEQKSLSIGKKQKISIPSIGSQLAQSVKPNSSQALRKQVYQQRKESSVSNERFEVIELKSEENIKLQQKPRTTIDDIRVHVIRCLIKRMKKQLSEQSASQENQDVYFPVTTEGSRQPDRLSIPLQLLKSINPQILKSTAKVQVEVDRIKEKKSQQQDVEIDAANERRKSRQSIYLGGGSQNQVQDYQTKYVDIAVFLTSGVYRRQSVEKVVLLLQTLKNLTQLNYEVIEDEAQWMDELDGIMALVSVQQVQNILHLIEDIVIKGDKVSETNKHMANLLKLFVWIEQMCMMSNIAEQKFQLIDHVRQQTHNLIQQAQELNQSHQLRIKTGDFCKSQRQIFAKQQQIISLIRDYHQKSTINNQMDQFPLKIFFQFFNQQLQAHNNMWFFASLEQTCLRSEEFLRMVQVIEGSFAKFFLVNSGEVFGGQCRLLELLMNNLDQLFGKDNEQREVDKNPYHTVTVTISNHQYESYSKDKNGKTPLPLIKLLKFCLSFATQNITHIPINIFLSRPLQSFEDLDEAQPEQQDKAELRAFEQNRLNVGIQLKKLKRFVRNYFVRGHNCFDRHQSAINQLDNDSRFLDLITDLLQMYIKVMNYEISIIGHKETDKISNVIQLINHEYNKCLKINPCFNLKRIKGTRHSKILAQQMVSCGKTTHIKQSSLCQSTYSQKIDDLKLSPTYSFKNFSFLINWPRNGQANFAKTSFNKQYFSPNNSFNQSNPKSITLQNNKISFPLSKNSYVSQKYSSLVKIKEKNTLMNNTLQTSKSLEVQIIFIPAKSNPTLTSPSFQDQCYELNFLNTQLRLNGASTNQDVRKTLFSIYEVIIKGELIIRNELKPEKQVNKDFQIIYVLSAGLLIFDNFKTSCISSNSLTLQAANKQQQTSLKQISLANIHKISLQIHSQKLPILEHSLSFVNLRLNKYLKCILPQLSKTQQSTRKTIGGRFTQHLSKRNIGLQIQGNMGLQKTKNKQGRNTEYIRSTLYDLPQALLHPLLDTDKCYVQDEEKLLRLIDEFYERNQPLYDDYILYLAIRPKFLRLSTALKHFFANRSKYQQSQILNSFVKLKTSSPFSIVELCKISNAFSFMPRISSIKPLKNVKDTLEERDLLLKYAKESSKRQSLQKNTFKVSLDQNSQNGNSIFAKKSVKLEVDDQERQESKDVEI